MLLLLSQWASAFGILDDSWEVECYDTNIFNLVAKGNLGAMVVGTETFNVYIASAAAVILISTLFSNCTPQ